MATPLLDVRINFDGQGLNRIANDSFETNATGWSASAGIQVAATSITRTATTAYEGSYVGRMVTTSTSGSGVKFVMSSTFTANVTYRFRVAVKSVSGSTALLIRIGSLGTVGDRAQTTATISGSWARYQVSFTPSSDRTDVQVNVCVNASATMTADIDAAEVYQVEDDVTADVADLTIATGANFEGGLAQGQATVTLKNDIDVGGIGGGSYATQDLPPKLLRRGLPVFIRATYGGVPYGLFYGTIDRVAADVAAKTLTAYCSDPVATWERASTVGIAASASRSIAAFRGAILDAMGESSTRRTLSALNAEADIPLTGADNVSPLGLLSDIDASTNTLAAVIYGPSTSTPYRYVTRTDYELAQQGAGIYIDDAFTEATWELLPADVVTDCEVDYQRQTLSGAQTVWTYDTLPFTVPAGQTRTIWASFTGTTTGAATAYTATNSPTVTSTMFDRAAKIVITAGGSAAVVSALSISGELYDTESTTATYTAAGTGYGDIGTYHRTVTAPFVNSPALAEGLARRVVARSQRGDPRWTTTITNTFPASLTTRIGDAPTAYIRRVSGNIPLYAIVESLGWQVSEGGARWDLSIGAAPLRWYDWQGFILDDASAGQLDVSPLGI